MFINHAAGTQKTMAAGAAGAGHKKTRCLVDIHINVKASLCSAAMNQLKARQSRLIPQGAFTGVLVHAFKRPENFLRCSETWSRGDKADVAVGGARRQT